MVQATRRSASISGRSFRMLSPDERPEGTIRVHFIDNTYKTLKLTYETPASDIINELCKRISAGGKRADPERHELFVIAPGNQSLRERRLLHGDRPLQIQVKGGSTAFKFLFREVRPAVADSTEVTSDGLEAAGDTTDAAGTQDATAEAEGAAPVLAADMSGMLRRGSLEKLWDDGSAGGGTWYACTLILDEDRLWYSQGPSGEDGGVGGGMAFLPLSECDRVLECEDKRLLQLVTKGSTMTFRAKSGHERNNWLLAVVKQAAFIKERDILLQAERIIAGMEVKRSSRHLARLQDLGQLAGVLADQEARDLFLDYVKGEHGAFARGQDPPGEDQSPAQLSAVSGAWPAGVQLDDVLMCLSSYGDPAANAGAQARAVLEFVEGTLFQKFQDHPAVQNRLCRIAAEIG
uniref:PH domain-containing protein n=1 Tax=Alexandrium monilatum TaxID=311494 RepID=A0A7S4R5Q5_9DINO